MRTSVGRGPFIRGAALATLAFLAACTAPAHPWAPQHQPVRGQATTPAPPGPPAIGDVNDADRLHLLAIGNLPIATIAVDSTASGLPATRMLDADLATQWANGGYRNATSWAVAGLAASAKLSSITIKTPPNAGTFDIQVSGTGTTWTTVRSGLFNTTWNPEVKALPAGTTGRYLRVFWRNRATSPLAHFSIYHLRVTGEATTASPAPSSPTPTPVKTPTPTPTPTSSTGLICPSATPAPGGGTTCYPAGTVFVTGNVRVTVGKGGVFTPNHVYIRPGATTTIVNIDTSPHTFTGFNGATYNSGPIPPGGSITKSWTHPGTWYFHDILTSNPPTFALTDVPY